MGRLGITSALIVAAIGVAFAILARAILPSGTMGWDEGYHALWGARILANVRHGDLLAFAYDSYRQVYWPPLHSWWTAFWLGLFGETTVVARASSLPAFVLTVAVVAAGGQRLAGHADRHTSMLAGVVAGGSVLASGGVLALASQAMIELPALLMLSVGVLAYWRTHPGEAPASRGWFALVGVMVFATFLMKQNYGVLLALGVAGAFLLDGQWWRPFGVSPTMSLRRRRQLVTAAVLFALLAVWFAYPQKLVQTVASLRNEPFGPDANSLDGVLFYPRQTLWLAGSWPLLIGWIGAVIGAFALRLRDPKVWPLLILIVLQAVFAQLSVTKVDRHILPLVPAVSLLMGALAAVAWSRAIAGMAEPRRAFATRVLGGVVVVAALVHALVSPAVATPVSDAAQTAPSERIVQRAHESGTTLIIGDIDTWPNPPILDWLLLERRLLTIDGAGSMRYASEIRFATGVVPRLPEQLRSPLQRLVDRWPGAGTASAYFGVPLDGGPFTLSSDTAESQLLPVLDSRRFDAIIVLPIPQSARNPDGTQSVVVELLRSRGYQRTEAIAEFPRGLVFRRD